MISIPYSKWIPLLLVSILCSCGQEDEPVGNSIFKQEMRAFVKGISQYSRATRPGFLIVPQNGHELVSATAQPGGFPDMDYLNSIDALGREDLFYGYQRDNKATPEEETTRIREFLDAARASGKQILVTDYCSSPDKMDDSYSQNHLAGYISFAADERDLNRIPAYPDPIFNENTDVVDSLEAVRNFLYILDPSDFGSKQGLIQAVTATNYDLLIMDLFWESEVFSPAEVLALRQKANGGKRLLLAYMSIGEAEDYRYYWDPGWKNQPPVWLDQENPAWKGNFKVRYWEPEWQSIIFGNDSSYVKQILDAGFDGVYLDIIDAFEFYEGQ